MLTSGHTSRRRRFGRSKRSSRIAFVATGVEVKRGLEQVGSRSFDIPNRAGCKEGFKSRHANRHRVNSGARLPMDAIPEFKPVGIGWRVKKREFVELTEKRAPSIGFHKPGNEDEGSPCFQNSFR
jgi:hypothetical protein